MAFETAILSELWRYNNQFCPSYGVCDENFTTQLL